MMKNLLLYILSILPILLNGQSLSLQELWNNADKTIAYKQNSVESQIKEQELKELKNNRIPIFYIDANLQRNLIIPSTPVPAIAFDPNAKDGAIIPLKFATKWSSKAGLQLEWNLFDPQQKIDEQQKSIDIKKASIDIDKNRSEWVNNATLAYAEVILATQQFQMAQDDSTAYAAILDITKKRYDEGRETLSNYIITQQEAERKQIQIYEAWSVLLESDLQLREYTDLNNNKTLSTSIDDIIALVEKRKNPNYTIQSLEIDQQNNSLQISNIKRQLLPTLTANAYLGQQYFSNELRLDRAKEWFGNSYANLALKIPISAFFITNPSRSKATLTSRLTNLKLEEETKADDRNNQIKAVKTQYAKAKIEKLQSIEKLANSNKTIQQTTYREGRLLISDLNTAILDHTKAIQDVWQAKYDLIKLLLED